MNDLSHYDFLWNGTELGWELHVHDSDCVEVWITLPASGATADFIKSIRTLLPRLGSIPPATLRSQLKADEGVSGGLLDGYGARAFQKQALSVGILVELRNLSRRTYRLRNSITGEQFPMEQSALLTRIAEAAIRNGIRTRYTTE